jgi:hypothetical protein
MAEDMDGRRELQTLAAGVFEAHVFGVICGVGRQRDRTRAGVGGRTSVFGSRKRGSTVEGVGVLSCEVVQKSNISLASLTGVGVATGVEIPKKEEPGCASGFGASLDMGTLSSSGVSSGTTCFHVIVLELRCASGV